MGSASVSAPTTDGTVYASISWNSSARVTVTITGGYGKYWRIRGQGSDNTVYLNETNSTSGSFTATFGKTYVFQAISDGWWNNDGSSVFTVTQDAHVHSYYYSSTVSPTCTEQGYEIYSCSCGAIEHRNYTSALGHDQVDTVIDPTCTEQGYTTHTCTRCGITLSANDTFTDALGHAWDSGEVIEEPTYTEDGTMKYTCTRCSVTRTEAIAKKVGSVRIYNGSTFDIYSIYVCGQDNSWGLYVPYIYNGSSWDLYS